MPSLEDKFLYHFTKADSIFEIIKNMTLKLSSFKDLNDLNEKEIKFSWSNWQNGLSLKKFIVNQCKLISFTQNFERNSSHCHCGCNHPRMWAQYAENNKGACIVINEQKLIEQNKKILEKCFWKTEDVDYKEAFYNDKSIDIDNPREFVEKYYKKLFFEKNSDWSQEDERRLLFIGDFDYLSIDGCIEFICLGNEFDTNNYSKLADILIASLKKDFEILSPHDFSFQLNAEGRSIAMDNAFRIVENIEKHKDGESYLSHFDMN